MTTARRSAKIIAAISLTGLLGACASTGPGPTDTDQFLHNALRTYGVVQGQGATSPSTGSFTTSRPAVGDVGV